MNYEEFYQSLKRRSFYSSLLFFFFISCLLHLLLILVSYFFLPLHLPHIRPIEKQNNESIEVTFDETPAALTPFNTPSLPIEGDSNETVESNTEERKETKEEEKVTEELSPSSTLEAPPIDYKKKALENLFKKKEAPVQTSTTEEKKGPRFIKSLFVPPRDDDREFQISTSQIIGTKHGNSCITRNGDPSKQPTATDMKLSSYMRQLGMLFFNNLEPLLEKPFEGIIKFYFEFNQKGALIDIGSDSTTTQKNLEARLLKEIKLTFPVFSIPSCLQKEKFQGILSFHWDNMGLKGQLVLR